MSIDTNKWDELLRQTTGNYRVDNTDEDIARFKKKLFRFNFFRFSFYTFNIFYASVAFGMMVIGGYSGYKYINNIHKKTSAPAHIIGVPADSTRQIDTLSKIGTQKSTLTIKQSGHIHRQYKPLNDLSKFQTDTNKIKNFTPDTIKLTVSDTIYKKVKVVVRDTVKIKKKKVKQLK